MNSGKICVSVCAETADEMIENIERAEEVADVVEVRFDKLNFEELDKLLDAIKGSERSRPLLAAMHSTVETQPVGDLVVQRRHDVWEKILGAGISDYFDPFQGGVAAILIEEWKRVDTLPPDLKRFFESEKKQKFILSRHDFDGPGMGLDENYQLAADSPADILKFAVYAGDVTGSIPVWRLLAKAHQDHRQLIPIAMGEAGKWTRILGLAHGAFMTYAALDAGDETAPGQLTARDLTDIYRVKELDLDTKVFGIIGDPVSQSISPYMQNPAFVSAGFNGVFIPLLVHNIDEFMRRMVKEESREVELNFGGFSVTMPHKQTIMKHLDQVDPTAEKIGAVNTVKITDGKLKGYNTDAHGFITPLKEKFGDLRGARVSLFGAGGAARACVYALKEEGADVTVFARDPQKGRAFAEEFGVGFEMMSDRQFEISNIKDQRSKIKDQRSKISLARFDLIVDATPMGMKGDLENKSLFTAEELAGVKFVYDLVTKPTDTPIIIEAKKAGIPAIGGLEMLVAQGMKQFEIWTGLAAPGDIMKVSVLARMDEIKR